MTRIAVLVACAGLIAAASSASAEDLHESSGIGLDTCQDPTSQTLYDFYEDTPYVFWGIYIGGNDMGCSQPNLNATYIQKLTEGPYNYWWLAPIWVGAQDPCYTGAGDPGLMPDNTTDDYNWGYSAAQEAYTELQTLDMGNGVPITDDLEPWYTGSGTPQSCINDAQAYISGWSAYLSHGGVYGSIGDPCPGASDLTAFESITNPPHHIFGADWDGNSDADEMGDCLGSEWSGSRLKQYLGPHNVTEQGVTLSVDSDSVDGPLYAAPPS